jgi:hypothetical protein
MPPAMLGAHRLKTESGKTDGQSNVHSNRRTGRRLTAGPGHARAGTQSARFGTTPKCRHDYRLKKAPWLEGRATGQRRRTWPRGYAINGSVISATGLFR